MHVLNTDVECVHLHFALRAGGDSVFKSVLGSLEARLGAELTGGFR